jgi:hypothetical protein
VPNHRRLTDRNCHDRQQIFGGIGLVSFFGLGKRRPKVSPSIGSASGSDARGASRQEITQIVLQHALDMARDVPQIKESPVYRCHAIALGHAVSTAVGEICFTELRFSNEPPFYANIWRTMERAWFADLSAFLCHQFIVYEFPTELAEPSQLMMGILSLGASIYPASDRARSYITQCMNLRYDQRELRRRCILGISRNSPDQFSRGAVLPFIVNEIIGGPSLELDIHDEAKVATSIDPCYSLWLNLWLNWLHTNLVRVYREATIGGRDLPLSAYLQAADSAMKIATEAVQQAYG